MGVMRAGYPQYGSIVPQRMLFETTQRICREYGAKMGTGSWGYISASVEQEKARTAIQA